ncbi:hypothetical protein B9Z55_000555 [Caenorhabditis nigoni]|uniref:F-box domain-containing protein n=1 Tax=Caenorhabditis nigoni TaxID=1611254 RepID=A0A2G5VTR5_9PELO|nr:hypothetical protein B9Z55_000555 [Caenorhabditis nigoni]
MHEDNEVGFCNFARMISMKNNASGKNFIKIGDGRFWTNFCCHVLPHMVKPHFWAHFDLELALCSGYQILNKRFLILPTQYKPLTIIADDVQSAIQFFHFHLYSFFGPEKTYSVYSSTLFNTFVPFLPNISSSQLWLQGVQAYSAPILEQFLEMSPNHHTLRINSGFGYENSEKVARIPNLVVSSSIIYVEKLLPNFQGSRLIVNSYRLPETCVIDFLKKWKSGKGYELLEFVHIRPSLANPQLNQVEILGQVDGKRFDISKEPPKFYCWKIHYSRTIMKLFNYPHVIQTEIIQSLPLYDVVNMSLCSKNFKNYLKRNLSGTLEKIWHIQYSSYRKSSVGIQTNLEDSSFLTIKPFSDVQMVRVFTRYNLFGKEFWCCLPTHHEPLTIIEEDDQSVIRFIHSHLYNFFGTENTYSMLSDGYTIHLSFLPNISRSRIFIFDSEDVLKRFLEFSSKQHTLAVVQRIDHNYNEEVAQIPNLVVISSEIDMKLLLSDFHGSRLFVETLHQLPESSVVDFLRAWKSGEGYQQLEFVQILNVAPTFGPWVVNHAQILEKVDMKTFDSSTKNPKLHYWKSLPTHDEPLTIIADDDQSAIQIIHFYLYNFLGPEKTYSLYSDCYPSYIPLLSNISSSRINLGDKVHILEKFLELSPNHHTLSIHCGTGYENREIVGRVPNLALISSGIDMEFLFPNFQGSRLYVETSYLHKPSAVEFLRKWKSGEGYEQVESVQIRNMFNRRQSLVVNHERLLEQVDVKRIDNSKEPPKFYYWRRYVLGDQLSWLR